MGTFFGYDIGNRELVGMRGGSTFPLLKTGPWMTEGLLGYKHINSLSPVTYSMQIEKNAGMVVYDIVNFTNSEVSVYGEVSPASKTLHASYFTGSYDYNILVENVIEDIPANENGIIESYPMSLLGPNKSVIFWIFLSNQEVSDVFGANVRIGEYIEAPDEPDPEQDPEDLRQFRAIDIYPTETDEEITDTKGTELSIEGTAQIDYPDDQVVYFSAIEYSLEHDEDMQTDEWVLSYDENTCRDHIIDNTGIEPGGSAFSLSDLKLPYSASTSSFVGGPTPYAVVAWCYIEPENQFSLTYSQEDWESSDVCLSGDTLITMGDGCVKALHNMKPGVIVACKDGTTIVKDMKRGNFSPTQVTYRFSNGVEIKETHDHRFFNKEQGIYQKLKLWNIGEHAITESGEEVKLLSKEIQQGKFEMFGLFTECGEYYANGLLCGNAESNIAKLYNGDMEMAMNFAESLGQDKLRDLLK